ncbi:MAG TPA: hypothetical protein VD816_10320 [Ohtaekwangia sp.]|nr:hypothetical protein [Ohtaekwangia sp.]
MVGAIFSVILLLIVTAWIKPRSFSLDPVQSRNYLLGVVFRIIGTASYMYYAINLSGGSVDAFIYDNYAAVYAEYFKRWDFSPFTDKTLWRNGELFYTNFVAYPAALFMIITGNSMFGMYMLFSLVCFAGLVLLMKAFIINYPALQQRYLALLLFLFPALWFWTSTIGKDAFMFLGLGFICYGIADKKLYYLRIVFGLAILYAFRPPVAYMAAMAIAAFFILNVRDVFSVRILKVGLGTVLLLYILNTLSAQWGLEEFSGDSIATLQQGVLRNNDFGTGALEQKSGGFTSIPRGVVDVLARPFLWEGTNLLTLASAIEINFALFLLLLNRRPLQRFLKDSLRHRLSTFVTAFVVIYVLSVGLFENNIGLIARHRTIIFPFLFLMAYGYYYQYHPVVNRLKRKIKPNPVRSHAPSTA